MATSNTTRLLEASTGTVPLAAFFVLLWNSGFVGAEYGLPYSGPFTLLFWRYAALSLILLAVVVVRQEITPLRPARLARTALIGLLSHGVWLGGVLVALDQGVPAGIVALIVALQPMLTGALAPLVTGENTDRRQWIGLGLGFSGVAIAVGVRLFDGGPVPTVGYLLPLGSAVAITGASLIQRRYKAASAAQKVPLTYQLFIHCTVTTAAVAIPAVLGESLRTDWVTPYMVTLGWLVLGVSLGAYGIMWELLDRWDATRVASLFYLGPPVTALMAWVAFGDVPTLTDMAGLAVVAVGVWLVTRPNEK